MGKISGLFLTAALLSGAYAYCDPAWTDLAITKINKEAPHAFFTIADNFKKALEYTDAAAVDKIYEGNAYRLLNGKWKFFFAENQEDIKDEYFSEKFDDSHWKPIDVPGTWQTQGYDTISYTNTKLEMFFDRDGRKLKEFENLGGENIPIGVAKPFVPEMHRQAGIYRREFEMPKNWGGKNVFLKFAGVKSGIKLYVNGRFAGYSEGSFTPAEFNITKYLKDGKNSIAALVYKFTTGSFFEVQDMPHTMGIFRDVVAVARPPVFIRDYYAVADISEDLQTADFSLSASLQSLSGKSFGNIKLEAFIADEKGNFLNGGAAIAGVIENIAPNGSFEFKAKSPLKSFKLWSPDKPNLYTIAIRLSDDQGKEIETIKADWAFRKMEIRGTQVFLNNTPFLFKGVNRHNWSPDKASAVDFKWMKLDCELIKQANINSIRTSHYPNDEKFYMLCSRYGIAVMDENNHETHDLRRHLPAENDLFVPMSVERMQDLVMRDRNVPSVFIWSLGNESGTYHTKAHKAMEAEARRLDPTRPIHSEPGAGNKDNSSDFVSPMYGGMGRMQRYLDGEPPKPFIFCEYCFAQGNAIGNLKDIWSMMRKEPSLNGGFIWDWCDRTIYMKNERGETFLADGRDYGTKPDSGTWCASGMVFADRRLPPKYFEVRRVYQDIQIDEIDLKKRIVKFKNEFVDTNLSEFDIEVVVEQNGNPVGKRSFEAPGLAPGKSTEMAIELPKHEASQNGKYFYTINVLRRAPTLFAKKGDAVASAQFFLKESLDPVEIPSRGNITVTRDGNKTVVLAGDGRAVFDTENPRLVSFDFKGETLISSPVEFDISSAWMDNHGRFKHEAQMQGLSSMKLEKHSFKTEKLSNDCVRVLTSATYANLDGDGFAVDVAYTILGSGAMEVSATVTKLNEVPENLLLPRVGLRMGLDKSLNEVSYFGRGPLHNYNDKREAAPFGLYKIDLSNEIVQYAKPQDCGNREEVSWMNIASSSGRGIVIAAVQEPLPMSILPNTQAEIWAAKHYIDLPKSEMNEFRIAWKVAGVGNGALGPNTLEKYQPIFKGGVNFKFVMIPYAKANENMNFMAYVFPKKFSESPTTPSENIRDEKLKPVPQGRWISKDAKVSYSSREDRYAPKNDTLLDPAGENFAFHTKRDDDRQYLVVDLGVASNLTGAVIYNRKDDQGGRTDNMLMFVSQDGKEWREVWKSREAKRSWFVNFNKPEKARYVKLLLDKKEYFHLSGLKIYAK